jgi:hypothetical protein
MKSIMLRSKLCFYCHIAKGYSFHYSCAIALISYIATILSVFPCPHLLSGNIYMYTKTKEISLFVVENTCNRSYVGLAIELSSAR